MNHSPDHGAAETAQHTDLSSRTRVDVHCGKMGSGANPIDSDDWVVPLPAPRNRVPNATHFRSTWITASQGTLKARGLRERYEAQIAPEHRDVLLNIIAGEWLPMDIAHAHYSACDRLRLPADELLEIGIEATKKASKTHIAFVVRMAQGMGVTPWTLLSQTPRIWTRTFRGGGAIGVARLGPKDARLEIVGFPVAGLRYLRVTMRTIVGSMLERFCERAYAKDIPAMCDERVLAMRLSWV